MFNPLKPFQKSDDRIFSVLIKEEFLKDLEFISSLISISEKDTEKIPMKDSLLDSLRQKYVGKNPLYKYASQYLKEEYNQIRDRINRILWLDSLRGSYNPRSPVYQKAYKSLRREINQIFYN